ncbi:hypothetical protein SESBI_24671 [Sesbania bispinosa]|nr:hypothetical protein SESBI_24671 [Sesbania bispinosa]
MALATRKRAQSHEQSQKRNPNLLLCYRREHFWQRLQRGPHHPPCSRECNPTPTENNPTSTENNEVMTPGLKLQLRSNSMRSDRVRMRIQHIVDEGLKKLQKCAADSDINEPIDESDKASERGKRTERLSAISTDIMEQDNEMRKAQTTENDVAPTKELDYSLPELVGTIEIDQETLNTIEKHFSSSLEYVEEL